MPLLPIRAIHGYLSRSTASALLVLVACVQPPEGMPSTTDDTSTTASDTTASNPSSSTGTTGTGETDGSGSTTGEVLGDPCLAFTADACPPECTATAVFEQVPGTCELVRPDEHTL